MIKTQFNDDPGIELYEFNPGQHWQRHPHYFNYPGSPAFVKKLHLVTPHGSRGGFKDSSFPSFVKRHLHKAFIRKAFMTHGSLSLSESRRMTERRSRFRERERGRSLRRTKGKRRKREESGGKKRRKKILLYCSTYGDDTGRPRVVRRCRQHDKPDVCHTLQLGATSLHLLVLQWERPELRQSQRRRLRDNWEGWRRHHLLASHSDGAALGLRGVQLQAEQRQYGVHQGSCPKWWVFAPASAPASVLRRERFTSAVRRQAPFQKALCARDFFSDQSSLIKNFTFYTLIRKLPSKGERFLTFI